MEGRGAARCEHAESDGEGEQPHLLAEGSLRFAQMVARLAHGGTFLLMNENQCAYSDRKILPHWAASLFAVLIATGLVCAVMLGFPVAVVVLAAYALVGGVVAWLRVERLASALAARGS